MLYDNSRYLHTPLYDRDNLVEPILKIRERFTFDVNNCSMHEWCEGDTLDGLAVQYYDSAELRWAILDVNVGYRSELDIQIGDILLIPDYEEVVNIVNV